MNLGELFVKLGVSDEEYYAAISKAVSLTEQAAARIEKSIGSIKPSIDARSVEGLCKAVEAQADCAVKVQRGFDRNPLTPKTDDRHLTQLNKKLRELKKGVVIPIGFDVKGLQVASKSPSGSEGTDRIVKAIEGIGKKSILSTATDVVTAPIKIAANVASDVVGSIATGGLEKVGRDLSSNLSEGLSSGLRQELSYTIGSLDYIGEQIGRDVIKGITDSLGRDAEKVEKAIADIVGVNAVGREGAAVRGTAAVERGQRLTVARSQAAREFGFVKAKLPEIQQQGKEAKFDRARLQLNAKRIQEKVDAFAEQLGQSVLEGKIEEIDGAIAQISEDFGSAKGPKQIQALSDKAKELATQKERLVGRIEGIRKSAEARFDAELKIIDDIDGQILGRERQLGRYASAVDNAAALGVKPKTQSAAVEVPRPTNPEAFDRIAEEVAKASGVALSKIPAFAENSKLSGSQAEYQPTKNRVELSPEIYQSVKAGEISAKQIESVVHELRHAVQLSFGDRRIKDGADPSLRLLRLNRSEARQFGRRVELSTDSARRGGGDTRTIRALEQDAYAFAERNSKAISDTISKQLAEARFTSQVGVGGGRIENQVLRARNTAAKYVRSQRVAGVGSDEEFENTVDAISEVYKNFSQDIDSLVNIDLLPVEDIEAAGIALNQKMRESIESLKKIAVDYGKVTLPELRPEKELVPLANNRAQQQAQVSQSGSASTASVQRTRINRQTYSDAGDIAAQSVSASQEDIEKAIAEAQRLADSFKNVYALLKDFVKEGDLQKVEGLQQDIARNAKVAQDSIDRAIAQAKTLDTPDRALVNRLGGQKGQIGRKVTLAQQQAVKLRNQQQREAAKNSADSSRTIETDADESLKSVEDIANNVREYLGAINRSVEEKLNPDLNYQAQQIGADVGVRQAQREANIGRAELQVENRYNRAAQARDAGLGRIASIGDDTPETLGDRISRIFRANGGTAQAQKQIGGLIATVGKYTGALTALGVFSVGFTAFRAIASQATEAAVAINNAERKLKLALGSFESAQQRINSIRASANELGTNATQDIAGETRLQIAARGTSLAGNNASAIAESVQSASAVFGLDGQEQAQAYRALDQTISKGKVSAEELRGQLGEVLPGAFQTAARAIGVTTEELDRMLAAGEVMSSDLLPKLAAQMKAENFEGLGDAAATYTAATNRVANEFDRLKQSLGQSILPAQTVALNQYAKVLSFAADNAAAFATAAGTLLAAIGTLFVKGILPVLASTKVGIAIAAVVKTAIAGVAAALLPVIATVAVIAAVLGTAYIAFDVFGNSAGESGKIAKTSTKNLEQLRKELDGVRSSASGAGKALASLNSSSDDSEGLRARGVTDRFRNIPLLRRLSNRKIRGQQFGVINATNTLNQQSQDVVRETRSASGTTEFQEYKRLESELDSVRQQRENVRLINPEDLEAIKELTRLESELTEKQSDLAAVINAPTAALDIQARALESALSELERSFDSSEIGFNIYTAGSAELKARLEEITAEQKRFNDALSNGNRQYQDIIRNAAKLSAAVEDSGAAAGLSATQQRTGLNSDRTLTEADRSYRESLISRAETEQKLAANAQAIALIESELQSREIRNVTDGLPLGTLGENVGSSEIERLLGETDNPGLEAALTLMRDLKSLQDSTASLAEDQSRIIRDLQEQIEETDDAISDYYEQLREELEELQLDLDASENSSAIAKVKSDITNAINDTGDNLLSGISDLLVSQVEAVNQEVQAQLELQRGQVAAEARRVAGLEDIAGIQQRILQPGQIGAATGVANVGSSGGAFRSGLFTAPESNNGGSAEYHIDTKISRDASDRERVALFDSIARGYAEMGKEIEFSNAAVAGEIYDLNASFEEKVRLLDAAAAAHSHSIHAAYDSFDYYIPDIGRGRNDRSAENAEILLPQVSGGSVEYGSGGRYGNYATILDGQGNVVLKTGHGDDGRALPSNRSFAAASQPLASRTQPAGSTAEANLNRFFDAIAYLESNMNTQAFNRDAQGNVYASGAFQFTPITRQDAAQLGLADPGDRGIPYEDQRSRAIAFARERDPQGVAAAERGDFREAERQLRQRWTSLPGAAEATQDPARYQQYYEMLQGGAGRAVAQVGQRMPEVPTSYGHRQVQAVDRSTLEQIGTYYGRVEELAPGAADAFKMMAEAAEAAGVQLQAISGFRSTEIQAELWDAQVDRRGSAEVAARYSAPPGYSEHETGNAIDIGDRAMPSADVQVAFENTAAYKWLEQNADQFGFEMSFPEGNAQGVSYEPWHWAYTGTQQARQSLGLGSEYSSPSTGMSIDPAISQRQSARVDELGSQVAERTRLELEVLQRDFEANLLSAGVAQEEARRRAEQTFQQAADSADQIAQSAQREQVDLQLQNLPDTPSNNYLKERVQIERSREDYLSGLTEQQTQLQNTLDTAEQAIAQYQSLGEASLLPAETVNESIVGIESVVNSTETALASVNESIEKAGAEFDRSVANLDQQFREAQEARDFAFRERAEGLEAEFSREVLVREANQQGRGFDAIDIEASLRVQSIDLDFDRQIRELEELVRNEIYTQTQADELRLSLEALGQTRLQVVAEEAEKLREALEAIPTDKLFEVQGSILDAQTATADIYGIGPSGQIEGAAEARAIAVQERTSQLDIEAFRDLAEDAGVAQEEIQRVVAEMERLNDIKLDNIRQQFGEWTPAINVLKDSTDNLFSSLFDRTKTVGEAFAGFFDNIISGLGQLAAQSISDGIFGAILGTDGGAGKERGGGGFLNTVIGGIANVFNFADGGRVPPAGRAFDAARGMNDPIGAALKREGPNSVLAALTPGELVLTPPEAANYLERKRVFNFAEGGVVPGGALSSGAVSPMQLAVNIGGVNTTVNGGSGPVDPAGIMLALQQRIPGIVQQEINKQMGLGGSLHKES